MLIKEEQDTRKRRLTNFQAAGILLFFAVCAVITVAAIGIWNENRFEYQRRSHLYDKMIMEAAKRNGLDSALLKAVIWRESRFRRDMIGAKGEIGLMQVMPQYAVQDWAKAHKKKVPSKGAIADPQLNIEIGSWYLGRAVKRWRKYRDCVALALCEYNAGFQRANEWRPKKPDDPVQPRIKIASTAQYVSEILEKRAEFDREFTQMEQTKKESKK